MRRGYLLRGALVAVAFAAAGSTVAPASAGARTGATAAQTKTGLEALVLPGDSVRAGGTGTAIVDVAHRSNPGVDARGVRVRIRGADGVSVTGARAPRWLCSASEGVAECTQARIGPDEATAPITVELAGAAGVRNGAAPIRADITWKERRAGTRGGLMHHADTTYGQAATDPGLGVRVSAVGPAVAREQAGDVVHLRAEISGIDGTNASIGWRQACLTSADAAVDRRCRGQVSPAARMASPVSGDDAHEIEVLEVELPFTAQPERLVFEATVREGGYSTAGHAVVITTPVADHEYDPGIDSIRELRSARVAAPAPRVTSARTLIRGGVGGRGPTALRAGRRATITARIPGRTIARTAWRVVGDGSEILRGAEKSSASIRVTPPPRLAGAVITLIATATLADGTSVELPELITVTSPARTEPRGRPSAAIIERSRATMARTTRVGSALASKRAHDSRGPDGTACDLATSVQRGALRPLPRDPSAEPGASIQPPDQLPVPDVALGQTGLLWLGTATATNVGGRCTVRFSGGELRYGDYSFVDVSGVITRDGLRVLGGAFNPPESWLKESAALRAAVTKAANDVLRFSVPEDSSVRLGASLAPDGEWRSLSGALTVDAGLSLLSLPGGWTFRPAMFELDVNGVMALTITAVAPEGESGSVMIRGSAGGGGVAELDVEAAGLVVMQQVVTDPDSGQARTSQVTASLGGNFDFTSTDDPSGPTDAALGFELSASVRGSLENLVLASNFTVERIGFEWTPNGISADARVRVGSGGKPTAVLSGAGTYRGSDDWSVRIASAVPWQVTDQLRIGSLEGSMARAGGRTTISARGQATGWPAASAFEFDSILAEVTNACPQPAVQGQPCASTAARVHLEATGRVVLPDFASGTGEKMPWSSTASIDLATRIFTLTGGLASAAGIGPRELRLTGITLQLSNDTSRQWCVPRGGTPTPKGDVRMGIAATGEVFGKKVEFSGEFGGAAGLCLVGRMGDMPGDVPSASLFREVEVAYTSQDVTVNLPTAGAQPAGARNMNLYARFGMPDGVRRAAEGEYFLRGTLGLADRSIQATVGVEYPSTARKILAGQVGGSHLALSGLDFQFTWTRTELSAMANARLDYLTPGNPDKGIAASDTPLVGSIGFDLKSATLSVGLGVDVGRAGGGTGEVVNAFGIQDLKVRALRIEGKVGGTTSVGFDADVSLPGRWGEPIGLKAASKQVLKFVVAQTEPCLQVAVRGPPPPQGQKAMTVLDIANVGLVTAREVGLTVAPVGCTLPGGERLGAGFAFIFDGELGGAFPVQISAEVDLPTPAEPSRFAVMADIDIGAFALGSVARFDSTRLKLDINPAASRYIVQFSGGLDIIGNRVDLAVDLRAEGAGNVAFSARSTQALGVVGFTFSGQQELDFRVVKGDVQRFRILADMNAKVLGVSVAQFRVNFDYDNGVVTQWDFRLGFGVPLLIARAEGNVGFAYALRKAPGRERPTDPWVRKTFDVNFGGRLKFLFWSTSFDWNVFHYEGALQGAGREGVDDTLTLEQAQPAPPRLPAVTWTAFNGAPKDDIVREVRVLSINYLTTINTVSQGPGTPTMTRRGGVEITACEFLIRTARCRTDLTGRPVTRTFSGDIDAQRRVITVHEAQADCSTRFEASCVNWRDVELSGENWTRMVTWIEAARDAYAKDPDNAKAGRVLPPVKSWSTSAVPTSLGWAWYRVDNRPIQWTFTNGLTDSRRNQDGADFIWGAPRGVTDATGRLRVPPQLPADGLPGRAVPVVADWDGDGSDGVALWYGRSSANSPIDSAGGRWLFRGDGRGPAGELVGPTPCPALCQPVEPPGTEASDGLPISTIVGVDGRGAAFPVAGNWTGYEKDGKAPDTPGLVTVEGGVMKWHLRPTGADPFVVTFGTFDIGGEAVPRPVTGDWNADGTTDIGVYKPPLRAGETGEFRLLTSRRYLDAGQALEPTPDIVIALGAYGDMPVTGDWNEDGITDVAVVSRGSSTASNSWRMRYVGSESCTTGCTPDRQVFLPSGAGTYPLAGRWR